MNKINLTISIIALVISIIALISSYNTIPNSRKELKEANKTTGVYASVLYNLGKGKSEILAGSQIPLTIITDKSSSFQKAYIIMNVYDSINGQTIVFPQATQIVGTYNPDLLFNGRKFIVWTKILFPNGDKLDLTNMTGTDITEYIKSINNSPVDSVDKNVVLLTTF